MNGNAIHANTNGKAISIGSKMSPKQVSNKSSPIAKQFEAAVNVIKNLPTDAKESPFQPSDDLKLKFYAYYKQATTGPNNDPKPSFYDIVGKYKWSAWKQLGDMTKEDAMRHYVDELKQIVETMSLSQPVEEFYEVLGPFYEFVNIENNSHSKPAKANGAAHSVQNSLSQTQLSSDESGDEEFSDTYDDMNKKAEDEIITARGEVELGPARFAPSSSSSSAAVSRSSRVQSHSIPQSMAGTLTTSGSSGDPRRPGASQVNEQVALAVLRLQQNMDQINDRLKNIEKKLAVDKSWWPFGGITPTAAIVILAWPFVAHLIMARIQNSKKN